MSRELESEHFKSFRRNWPEFPDGEVWHEDSPDFLVHTPEGVIGIEHSQVFQASVEVTPPQAVEATNRDIIALAQEHAELRGMPPVRVDVLFLDHPPFPKAQRLDLARQIAGVCFDHLPDPGDHCELEAGFRSQLAIPASVSRVWIHHHPSLRRHSWDVMKLGMVLEDATELLQNAIRQKQEKLPLYLERCMECWLLLVVDARAPSTFIEPNEESLKHVYTSSFHRTFLLNDFEGRVVELSTRTGLANATHSQGPA